MKAKVVLTVTGVALATALLGAGILWVGINKLLNEVLI